jgi:hypothetical protein
MAGRSANGRRRHDDLSASRLVGRSAPGGAVRSGGRARPAREEVVTGTRVFASDVRRPGMLVARGLRPPVPGAQVRSLDLGDVRGWPGLRVVHDGAFVAVAGQDRDLMRGSRCRAWDCRSMMGERRLTDGPRMALTCEKPPATPFGTPLAMSTLGRSFAVLRARALRSTRAR